MSQQSGSDNSLSTLVFTDGAIHNIITSIHNETDTIPILRITNFIDLEFHVNRQTTIQAMCNLLNIWQKCDPEVKDQFIKAIFPKGIVLERENGDYRTSQLNPAILVVSELMRYVAQTKKRNKMDLPTYSALVGGSRLISNFSDWV